MWWMVFSGNSLWPNLSWSYLNYRNFKFEKKKTLPQWLEVIFFLRQSVPSRHFPSSLNIQGSTFHIGSRGKWKGLYSVTLKSLYHQRYYNHKERAAKASFLPCCSMNRVFCDSWFCCQVWMPPITSAPLLNPSSPLYQCHRFSPTCLPLRGRVTTTWPPIVTCRCIFYKN